MEAAQRKVCRATITKLTKNAGEMLKQDSEDVNVEELGVMIARLNAANEKLQQANEKVLPLIHEDDFEEEFQRVAEYDDNVAATIARLEQRIKRLTEENRSNVGNVPAINDETNILHNVYGESRRNNNAIKLPKLELKKFNGQLEQWTQFWEQFRTAVHQNDNLDSVTKFNYLQSVLTDKAATTIKGLTPSEACYNDAIELLRNEYGNQQRIIDNYIQKLMSIAPVHGRNDSTGLRKLYNAVSSITRTLTSLGVNANQYGMMVKSVVLRAIPQHLRIEFYKQNSNESANADQQESNDYEIQIERLISFVKLELESMELAHSAASGNETSGKEKFERKANYSNKEFTAAGLLTKINECLFCKSKSHITADCNDSLNIDQRKDILKRNSRCFRCTKPNHTSRECRNRTIACSKCKGRHVTSMCDPRQRKEDKTEEKRGETKREENTTNLLAEDGSLNNVLLQTACAYITPTEKNINTNIAMVLHEQTEEENALKKFCDLETIGISNPETEDAFTDKFIEEKIVFKENRYEVDDLVIAVNSVEEAKTLYQKSRAIMARAGMNLRKWNTNDEELRKQFYEKDNEHSTTSTKILGIQWCVLNDELSTDLDDTENYSNSTSMITKRTVLQTISRIYDPLGLLSPFLIRIKLQILKEHSVPRSAIRHQTKAELHVFADASMKAFGVAAYLRETLPNEEIKVNLLMAKNRVAPLKEGKGKGGERVLTLPKIELTTAVCATRLQSYITSNISIQIQTVYLWTDSKIVVHWSAGEPEKWKPYVVNRVRELQKLSKDCLWKHCRGEDNPADLLTRGVKAKDL